MMPVGDDDLNKFISRCSVCQAPAPIITVHSQTTDLPNCPQGWKELWSGYSFVMHAVGAMAGGQQLASSGSCLETFQPNPYIECNSRGQCHFFYDKFSYWLVSVVGEGHFQPSVTGETLKGGDLLKRVGRCKVCVYQ